MYPGTMVGIVLPATRVPWWV